MGKLADPEFRKEYQRKKYLENIDKYKMSYLNNIEANKEKNRNYFINNRESLRLKQKQWRDLNKDKTDAYNARQKQYYQNNKQKKLESVKKRRNYLYKNNIVFRLNSRISGAVRMSFIRIGETKNNRSMKILGITYSEFKEYLESKFEPWMNWANHGKWNGELNYGWDIDHIIPICTAKTVDDILRLNHYTNLMPLCSHTNRYIKRGKI